MAHVNFSDAFVKKMKMIAEAERRPLSRQIEILCEEALQAKKTPKTTAQKLEAFKRIKARYANTFAELAK